jgi:hypothetical protein
MKNFHLTIFFRFLYSDPKLLATVKLISGPRSGLGFALESGLVESGYEALLSFYAVRFLFVLLSGHPVVGCLSLSTSRGE